jgi:hypothetical protein
MGRVVGESGGPYVWDAARGMRRFEALGGQSATATDINNARNVIGLSSTTAEDGEHLYFRERNGDVLDLGFAKIPFGLSNSGEVGFSVQSQQPPPSSQVFIWEPDTGERLLSGFPPDRLVLPAALNDSLHIVGSVVRDDQLTHAMRWTPEEGMEELTAPDEAGFSHAADVNESGTIVGYMEQGLQIRPFIWGEHSGLRDLTTLLDPTSPAVPQADLIEPRALNDEGWIAIDVGPRSGPYERAYVLIPKFRTNRACTQRPSVSGN